MKRLIAKVLGITMYVAADFGLMYGITYGLGLIWQRFELTEDYVENHPVAAGARIIVRFFILISALVLICIAPTSWVMDKICDLCDAWIPDKNEDKEWE